MKAILLVTWFYYGQAPASYQTPFENMDACLAARAAIMGDAVRLKVEAEVLVAVLSLGIRIASLVHWFRSDTVIHFQSEATEPASG